MNDSSTGGYLLPTDTPPPAHDLSLECTLQQIIVGLTGLSGQAIRPRWQPVVPKQPEPSTNWCAMGVTQITADANPAYVHDSTHDGSDQLIRYETLWVLCSFYGPQGMHYATQCRDGLYVSQNHDLLHLHRLALRDLGDLRSVPEWVNQQWIRRYDLELSLRHQIVRTYPILNLLSAPIVIQTDTYPPSTFTEK